MHQAKRGERVDVAAAATGSRVERLSAETVEGLYEQLAERRFRQAAQTLEQALQDPEQAKGLLAEMDGQAGALVALAGRLEQAADLEVTSQPDRLDNA